MPRLATTRRLELADLRDLCERYVPVASRHPKSRLRSARDTWWPAHELGHLLTVPRARLGQPLFGMDVNVSPFHPCVTTWWAYELAAMHVSRRLLIACGRPDLFLGRGGELEGTDWQLREYGSQALARRILRRRGVLRLPGTRAELDATAGDGTRRCEVTAGEFPGAIPFDLWDIVPPSLARFLPNVMWSRERLHSLALPVVALPVRELSWQLDLPWWRVAQRHFAVSPNQVRLEPRTYARHWQRTLEADLRFPIHLLQRERLIILDGVHRLLKTDIEGLEHVWAHVVSHAQFVDHVVERAEST